MYAANGNPWNIPQDVDQVEIVLEVMSCYGVINSLSDISEEEKIVLLKATITVPVP